MHDTIKLKNIKHNRDIIKAVANVVLYCGRQCIGLRGKEEYLNLPGNPGNFLALMRLLGKYNNDIKMHIEHPSLKNATYLSPRIQNELIVIMGVHIIQRKLVDEIKKAKLFTVLVDEVSSHHVEQMPLCIRFVDDSSAIREEFLEFCQLKSLTGVYIAQAIKQALLCHDLSLLNLRGQGYDGASNMSSERCGVQAEVQRDAPLAIYTHCAGHRLNLVISHSCSVAEICYMMDKVNSCCYLFWPVTSGLPCLQILFNMTSPISASESH